MYIQEPNFVINDAEAVHSVKEWLTSWVVVWNTENLNKQLLQESIMRLVIRFKIL